MNIDDGPNPNVSTLTTVLTLICLDDGPNPNLSSLASS